MKILALLACLLLPVAAFAGQDCIVESHDLFIYPVVRVTESGNAGSGTVIYSQPNAEGTYSTYVLTNHHVIRGAISVRDEWDPTLNETIKKERRELVHVEVFQYRDVSTSIGTLRVEADIVLYTDSEDMALLKLRSETPAAHIAKMRPREIADKLYVFDQTVAVGCSLAFPPLPTRGMITRLNLQVRSYPFHMSSAQIIYGNSGGAMFLEETGELIGVPSMVPVVGWSSPVTHMGLFIPIKRAYDWMDREFYSFIFDEEITEAEGLKLREEDIEARLKRK